MRWFTACVVCLASVMLAMCLPMSSAGAQYVTYDSRLGTAPAGYTWSCSNGSCQLVPSAPRTSYVSYAYYPPSPAPVVQSVQPAQYAQVAAPVVQGGNCGCATSGVCTCALGSCACVGCTCQANQAVMMSAGRSYYSVAAPTVMQAQPTYATVYSAPVYSAPVGVVRSVFTGSGTVSEIVAPDGSSWVVRTRGGTRYHRQTFRAMRRGEI